MNEQYENTAGLGSEPDIHEEAWSDQFISKNIPCDTMEVHFKRVAAGFYNAKVMGPSPDDPHHVTCLSQTGWKKNMITDVGLDKIANMPWAQVFQFCCAGTTTDTASAAPTDTKLKEFHSINSFLVN